MERTTEKECRHQATNLSQLRLQAFTKNEEFYIYTMSVKTIGSQRELKIHRGWWQH